MKHFIIIFILLLPLSNTQFSPSENNEIRVAVDADAPIIIIHQPKSISYNNATPILVNYTVMDITHDSTWYSLNENENITIKGPFYLYLPEGIYTLKIYANDSLKRTTLSQVKFKIDNTIYLCGNSICDAVESCSICPQDCGSCPQSTNGAGEGGQIPTKPTQNVTIQPENITPKQQIPNITNLPPEIIELKFNYPWWPIIAAVILILATIIIYIIRIQKQKTIKAKKTKNKNGRRRN